MKSTDAPKLDQKWWNKNKGLLVPQTGFGKLLGAFEVAEDQFDYPKQILALDAITKKLPDVIKLSSKDKDTVTVLNKYPNLIKEKKAEIVKKQDAEKQKALAATAAAASAKAGPPRPATGPPTAPPQKMGALEKLWSRDFALEVSKEVPWLQMKGYIVELKVNSDVLDVLAKSDGGSTAGLMIKDAQEICQKYVDLFVHYVESLQPALKTTSAQEVQKKAQDYFKTLHPKVIAEVKEVPKARWEKFKHDKPMWREYKIETAANIAIGSLQIVVGAASIAAAVPTMGATLGLAVVSTARGLFSTTTAVVNAVRSVESDQKELLTSLEKLSEAYLDGQKKATLRFKVQEVGAAVLKGFLGTDVPLFIESLPKCNKTYERWKPKVANLRIGHGKELKEALDLMDDIAKLEAEMKKSQSKEAVAIMGKIKKLRENVTKGLDEVHDLGGRITKAEAVELKLKEGLEELNKATPNYIKVFTVLFPAAVSIGLAAGAGGIEISHAESTVELAKAAVVVSEEVLSTIKEAIEK
jgi:hypothetical protein